MGEQRNGLHYFHTKPIVLAFSFQRNQAILWHQHLGHLSFNRLNSISELSISHLNKADECCDACHRAKQVRQSFPLGCIKSSETFALIHCDLWGPYHTPSMSKCHFFLTIIDDFIRTT